MTITIPAGTRIYLTRFPPYRFNIQPDKTILNDSLYVLYDVRVNGLTIIPRGTRVLGDWVTESDPTIAAQLQITKIFLCGRVGQDICADSDLIGTITEYNAAEVNDADYLSNQLTYISTSNKIRRIIRRPCKVSVLLDYNPDTVYIQIFTKEIPVILIDDFTPCICGC